VPKKIKESAIEKNDFTMLGKIQGIDLVAREAHHNSCRKSYTFPSARHEKDVRSEDECKQKEAYREYFGILCDYVEDNIVVGGRVERMTMLHERYLQYIELHYPNFFNPLYRTSKLKDKLSKHFSDRINFWQPNYKCDLVYSSLLGVGEAVEVAFESATSERRILEDADLILRQNIQHAYKQSTVMSWPSSTADLECHERQVPKVVTHILTCLISGSSTALPTNETERVVKSVAKNMCYTVTRGAWKIPKHLLLGLTLHHRTGSAQIVTIINRYGHCVSYSQLLELETAMCKQTMQQDSLLP